MGAGAGGRVGVGVEGVGAGEAERADGVDTWIAGLGVFARGGTAEPVMAGEMVRFMSPCHGPRDGAMGSCAVVRALLRLQAAGRGVTRSRETWELS